MDELMQTLFFHILDHTLDAYYDQTAYAERLAVRTKLTNKLCEQLNAEQQALFEELLDAYNLTQDSELEAIFLAAFDQCLALHQPHLTSKLSCSIPIPPGTDSPKW